MSSDTGFEPCARCGRERNESDDARGDWLEVDQGTVCPNCFTADEAQFVREFEERAAAEFMTLADQIAVEEEHESPEERIRAMRRDTAALELLEEERRRRQEGDDA